MIGPHICYDDVAPSFDAHRALPDYIVAAIRAAILAAVPASSQPRLLDLGAGTGRIGLPFVAANDDYVGVDLSLGMLREFARRGIVASGRMPPLVQADGHHLPFSDATFDAVLLIQVIGAARNWEQLVTEARRVLRQTGALITGHTVLPVGGLDEQMKGRLASLLAGMGVPYRHMHTYRESQQWLQSNAHGGPRIAAAAWEAAPTPRSFLDRQRTGARFSQLPARVQDETLRQLCAWATARFGSLDVRFAEKHEFELRVFTFEQGARF